MPVMIKRLFASLDVYREAGAHSAAMNMAIDEALLETAKIPSIRFYRWKSPALSFGYFGRFADVADYAAERDLVRRWTGGGIVFHGDDLTYSIIIPARDTMFAESSAFIYAAIHSALRDALSIQGPRAELAPAAEVAVTDSENSSRADRGYNPSPCSHAPVAPPTIRWPACHNGPQDRGYSRRLCFANPVSADVMIDSRKIAGSAQRRTRAGLLQQGSIQLATGRVRVAAATGHVDLENGLPERFASELSNVRGEKLLDKSLLERAEKIAERKYGNNHWLKLR
jgi:lipoyl(octanoyl) transferase